MHTDPPGAWDNIHVNLRSHTPATFRAEDVCTARKAPARPQALVQNDILRVPVHITVFLEARVSESTWEFKTQMRAGIQQFLLIRHDPQSKFPKTYTIDQEHWEQLRPILNPDIIP